MLKLAHQLSEFQGLEPRASSSGTISPRQLLSKGILCRDAVSHQPLRAWKECVNGFGKRGKGKRWTSRSLETHYLTHEEFVGQVDLENGRYLSNCSFHHR